MHPRALKPDTWSQGKHTMQNNFNVLYYFDSWQNIFLAGAHPLAFDLLVEVPSPPQTCARSNTIARAFI